MKASRESAGTDSRWLCAAAAFVWLWTGLAVLHPYYRAVGHQYLAELGLSDAWMYATCALEVVLGLGVLCGRAGTLVTLFQVVLILGFTTILACLEPMLLVNPDGILTKNLPLLAVLGTAWLLEREGWTWRAKWLLRGGMAAIWITEGLFPKILFQQANELAVVASSRLAFGDPALFLLGLGTLEAGSGGAALVLRGRPLRVVLACQLAGLVALPVLVCLQEPTLLVHPFGSIIKNVPIIVGTALVLRRCTS